MKDGIRVKEKYKVGALVKTEIDGILTVFLAVPETDPKASIIKLAQLIQKKTSQSVFFYGLLTFFLKGSNQQNIGADNIISLRA